MQDIETDILILGGGCSGWSLLSYLLEFNLHKKYRICLVEAESIRQTKTWSYWEDISSSNWKEDYVWTHICVKSASTRFEYYQERAYKSIQSASFYRQIEDKVSKIDSIKLIQDQVIDIDYSNRRVKTTQYSFSASLIIQNFALKGSTIEHEIKNTQYPLVQHFGGLIVESTKLNLDPDMVIFMDFDVPQDYGFAFMYILPYGSNSALFEYTLFSELVLKKNIYESEVKNYLKEKYHLGKSDFTIKEKEFGQIPMDDRLPQIKLAEHFYTFGSIAGMTKASTGYTFSRIQKSSKAFAESILINGLEFDHSAAVMNGISKKRYRIYDIVLLHVLQQFPNIGVKTFIRLFERIGIPKMLRFLSEDQSIFADMKVLNAAPKTVFIPAVFNAIKTLKRHLYHTI